MTEMVVDRPLICGFMKVRNEIVREGNLYRALANLLQFCDCGVLCDDASTDGTREHLEAFVRDRPSWRVLHVPLEEQRFEDELIWKQRMLQLVDELRPEWVWWHDGDEVLDAEGTCRIREFCVSMQNTIFDAFRAHYTQLWRFSNWARTDAGFDDGRFVKLWRWRPGMQFDQVRRTHHFQFPAHLLESIQFGRVGLLPFEVIHYGNFGRNLYWKCVQYWGGLGGVDRHLLFDRAEYRSVDCRLLPEGVEQIASETSPEPFTLDVVDQVRDLRNLRDRSGYFCVVVPTFNRSGEVVRAIDSLLSQTYEKWIAVVLDDGSTDDTQERVRGFADPRVCYCRYLQNRGGVVMNEIGMRMACEMAEFWTRLGSDDWFEPDKLLLDKHTFDTGAAAVYGPYVVYRAGRPAEMCNPFSAAERIRDRLKNGVFEVSWANCAVRTSVLRRVVDRFGSFCDVRLRNMEDFLVNARIARFADWTWRARCGGQVVVGTDANGSPVRADAVWTCSDSGASADSGQTLRDETLTRSLIVQENFTCSDSR